MNIRLMCSAAAFALLAGAGAACSDDGPMTWRLSFDDFGFLKDDFIARSGLKTVEQRGLTLEEGRFGKGLRMNLVPKNIVIDNMSGIDLDMVTATVFNTRSRSDWNMYCEPFFWGAGRLNSGSGAVAFWAKGPFSAGDLFDQSAMAWGRPERFLLWLNVDATRRLTATLTDSRYVRHTIASNASLADSAWNHIVLNWDRAKGMEIFLNGASVASSWNTDAWWETYLPGLMHFPMARVIYDEAFFFSRPLAKPEIAALMKDNTPPSADTPPAERTSAERDRLANAIGLVSDLPIPVAAPMKKGEALSFREVVPDYLGDGRIQGRFCNDGRYEMAWPHNLAVFTFIPGDASFKAEKLDITTHRGDPYNYVTLEGNLNGLGAALTDCRREGDRFAGETFFTVPGDNRFFYGAMVDRAPRGTVTLPFVKGYGAPDGYTGDVLHLPITGETRIHEVGLFDVGTVAEQSVVDEVTCYLNKGGSLEGRYDFALRDLNAPIDRTIFTGYPDHPAEREEWVSTGLLRWNHLATAPMTGRRCFGSFLLDMEVKTDAPEDVLLVRLRDPGSPSVIWTHAEVKLQGFDRGGRLRLLLVPPPIILEAGDVIQFDVMTRNGASVKIGGSNGARMVLRPAPFLESEKTFEMKSLRPVMAQFSKSYHHQPWIFENIWPDIMNPHSLGGQFDAVMPAMATLRILPNSSLAAFYVEWARPKYFWGSIVNPEKDFPIKDIAVPSGVPRWAYLQHLIQDFRYRVADWLKTNQNPDGQVGGGWDDDAIVFRSKLDMPFENPGMLESYLRLFRGMDATGIFKDGYCRIQPNDNLHNGQFISSRNSALAYVPGDPYIYRRALRTAWHYDKPDSTPFSWAQGKPFLPDRSMLRWYWGMGAPKTPYRAMDATKLDTELSRLASYLDDFLFLRHTEARIHTDNQVIYNESYIADMVMGGAADSTVSVGWLEGGGADLSRWVTLADSATFTGRMFSFDPLPRKVTVRLFRIEPGMYEVGIAEDRDGSPGASLSTSTLRLQRFDTVAVTVPSGKPVLMTVRQMKRESGILPLPDLAVASYDCVREGGSLTVRVSNFGAAPSPKTVLRLADGTGKVLGELKIPAIKPPMDFVEKSVRLTFTGVPAGPLTVTVDPKNAVREIYRGNNSTVVE
jgi:hypothetical protein